MVSTAIEKLGNRLIHVFSSSNSSHHSAMLEVNDFSSGSMKVFLSDFCIRMWRSIFAFAICTLLMLNLAFPAMAIGSSPSSPSKGVAEMDGVQAEAEEAIDGQPRKLEEVQSKAKEGANGVQGKAGTNMNTPENSEQATSVREQAKNAFGSITSNP